jgi:uncharacterized protein YkwD
MSDQGATARRRRSKRAAKPDSRTRRVAISIATVVLVITPISWILLHQPQSDKADASIPYVTRPDDTYITASNEPASAKTNPPSVTPGTPSHTPTKTPSGTPTPKASQTPGEPSTTPTDKPTAGSTHTPGGETASPSSGPTRTGSSAGPRPTAVPTKTTQAPPPPADNGSMTGDELQLFSLIDDARASNGCARLQRNTSLTGGARQEAVDRAASGDVSATGASKAAAGGDDMSAQDAFNRLNSQSSGTIMNCGLHVLGVGRGTARYTPGGILCGLGLCGKKTRVAWVVDFS